MFCGCSSTGSNSDAQGGHPRQLLPQLLPQLMQHLQLKLSLNRQHKQHHRRMSLASQQQTHQCRAQHLLSMAAVKLVE